MGFTPSFLKPNPPPLDFQQTKDNPRPQHFEHAPSDVGFGDKGDVDEGGGRGVQHVEQSSDAARMDAAELDDAVIAAEGEDKMNSFTYLLACAAGLSGFLFGYDTGVISGALVNMRDDIEGRFMTDVEKEWITSATSVGALFGAVGGGLIVDRIGRKWVLAVGDVFFVLGAVLVASSYHLEQIIIGRLILGFGVGIAAAITPMYIGELVTIQCLMITGGQVVSYALGAAFTMRSGWRILFAISLVPAFVQAGFVHFLPESPRYSLLKNKVDEAHSALSLVYSGATPNQIDLKIQVMNVNVKRVQAFNATHTTAQTMRLILTRGSYRRSTLVGLGLLFFQQFAGFNTLLYYSSTLFASAGFNNPTATGLIIAGANFVFTIYAALTLDKFGKRRTTLFCYPFMVLGLAMAAYAFSEMVKLSDGVLSDTVAYPKKYTSLMIGMIVVYVAAYASSIGTIPWHQAELFPLEIRGFSCSIGTVVCWASNIIVSATFLTMLNSIGAPATFGYYAGWCALALIFIYFCYPEVAQLTLEESSGLFENDFGVKRARALHQHKKDVRLHRRGEVLQEMNLPNVK